MRLPKDESAGLAAWQWRFICVVSLGFYTRGNCQRWCAWFVFDRKVPGFGPNTLDTYVFNTPIGSGFPSPGVLPGAGFKVNNQQETWHFKLDKVGPLSESGHFWANSQSFLMSIADSHISGSLFSHKSWVLTVAKLLATSRSAMTVTPASTEKLSRSDFYINHTRTWRKCQVCKVRS